VKPASPFISIVHLPFNGSFVFIHYFIKGSKIKLFFEINRGLPFYIGQQVFMAGPEKEQAIAIFHLLIKRVFKIGKTSGKVIKLKTGRLKKIVSPKKDSVIVTCYCLSPIMNRATINYFLK